VNVHLFALKEDFPGVDPHAPTPEQSDRIIATMHRDLEAVVTRFGPERVIVENIPYWQSREDFIKTCALPEVITAVIETHNCGLLLDISHARIAAAGLALDQKAYIRGLPLGQLRELHFTGLHDVGNGQLMDHLPVLEGDWAFLEWVLDNLGANEWGAAHLLAFEYGGEGGGFLGENSDPAVIAEQVPRLYRLCRQVSP
jgi:hypothetical protein